MKDFDQAFAAVIGVEGGCSNDPRDPGGETKYGISKNAYPNLNIGDLTLTQAQAIYRKGYWDRCQCDALPWPLSLYVFDSAVNQGAITAIRHLQAALGVTVDGILGPTTLQRAGQADAEHADLFLAERALGYMSSSLFSTYGRGWLKRLFVIARSVA